MAKPQRIGGLSRHTPLDEAGRRVLAARLSDVSRWQDEAPAPGATHAMRVASRRLRTALRLLGLRDLDAPVKELQDALGTLRDLQIQAEWLSRRDERLRRDQAALAPKAEARLVTALHRWRAETLPAALHAAQALSVPGKLGGRRARRKLRKRLARFDLRLAAALDAARPRTLHRLRIAAKKLRYLCELLEPALPDAARPLLQELEPLQQALGDLHDADVRIALLRRHRRESLLREEQEARERLVEVVEKELARWKSRGISRKARHHLRQ